MQNIRVDEVFFSGAVSYETVDDGIRPWRIPHERRALFAEPLVERAGAPAGVRLGLRSTTQVIELSLTPYEAQRQIDCVVDGELIATATIGEGEQDVHFADLPVGEKNIELYLSQSHPMTITRLAIQKGATRALLSDDKPRWVTYGSSITQCKAAASPAETWPAIVARQYDLALTCLGYSGQCHLEPLVAHMIRDLPADFISLCLGINVMGGATLNPRTFQQAVIGLVHTIRGRHEAIPLVVMSPIYAPDRETEKNAVGFNLELMREEIAEAVDMLQTIDDNIHYVNGLNVFGAEHEHHLPDRLHPDADGYRIMAKNFSRYIMDDLGIAEYLRKK